MDSRTTRGELADAATAKCNLAENELQDQHPPPVGCRALVHIGRVDHRQAPAGWQCRTLWFLLHRLARARNRDVLLHDVDPPKRSSVTLQLALPHGVVPSCHDRLDATAALPGAGAAAPPVG